MFPSDSDRRALSLSALSDEVMSLLYAHGARPRLVAHLTLVHDVARRLCASLRRTWPSMPLDHDAVTFGAATHDVGKALHPHELNGPGSAHERDGEALLLRAGYDAARARFARTHGTSPDAYDTLAFEDLLVITADTVWKGRRAEALEDALGRVVQRVNGFAAWEAFAAIDTTLEALTADADRRLAWQARFGVNG